MTKEKFSELTRRYVAAITTVHQHHDDRMAAVGRAEQEQYEAEIATADALHEEWRAAFLEGMAKKKP